MKYRQRDVVELPFELPNGEFKAHPCVIVSTDDLQEAESVFYAVMLSTKRHNEDYIFEITPDMFNYKTDKTSFAKCHLMHTYTPEEVIQRFGNINKEAFAQLIKHINFSIFGIE